MAKLSWGVLVGDARGKVARTVYQNTWAGRIIRGLLAAKVTPSDTQRVERGKLATLGALWKSSSMDIYRADWVTLAGTYPKYDVWGNPITLTGYSFFNQLNRGRQTLGLTPILAAPVSLSVTDPAAITVTHETGPPAELRIVPNIEPTGSDSVVILAHLYTSRGKLKPPSGNRIIKIITPGSSSPWDVLAEYTAIFGPPPTGTRIFCAVNYIETATGYASARRSGNVVW